MMPRGGQAAYVRQASQKDVEAILDLLTHYDLPRSHFEPWYYGDPDYRPDQSWVVERQGKLVAHLRVYDRTIRVDGMPLRLAGIGNVVTAREERGRGYAGMLLEGVLGGLSSGPFAYSLLWTHVPKVYAAYGWVPIPEELVRGTVSSSEAGAIRIDRVEEADLPSIIRLYERTNAMRTGPTVRSAEYWQAQRSRLDEDPHGFLVARRGSGAVAGYVRSREGSEFLELGIEREDWDIGRALLATLQERHGGPLVGPLPPSLRDVFRPEEREVLEDPGLMGRPINPEALVRSLEPLWTQRARGLGPVSFALQTDTGATRVEVRADGVRIDEVSAAEDALSQDEFGRLLFLGMQEDTGAPANGETLRALFPPQDYVLWGTDRF